MGKEKKESMNESALGSTFEISLRILLMLNELSTSALDEQQIRAIDFISVYAADFGLLDENLHGYSNYRFSEYPARKQMVVSALKDLVLDGYAHLYPTSTGYRYSITETGKTVCGKLTSSYAEEYIIAVQSVISRFANADAEAMLLAISRVTIQSLEKVGHE
ncbi:ABC-three component system middle component 2 [Acutalibacter caecimuris]|uniref:ABC-three component system middle component 2 n=1 Tax=Acutalibacter caecimuris TaxID=3093657 RepID=UPI002AC8BB5E|nr:ABC-three component system middle component 2 [Acutalibacter sp. M00118]